jgi:hypothetical protein
MNHGKEPNDRKNRVKALCDDFEQADKIIQDVKSITNEEVYLRYPN